MRVRKETLRVILVSAEFGETLSVGDILTLEYCDRCKHNDSEKCTECSVADSSVHDASECVNYFFEENNNQKGGT